MALSSFFQAKENLVGGLHGQLPMGSAREARVELNFSVVRLELAKSDDCFRPSRRRYRASLAAREAGGDCPIPYHP